MNKRSTALVSLATVLFFFSCQKIDTTDLGSDLIPVVDNVNTFDTVLATITDNFYLPDSTRITTSENYALGTVNDPSFGKTTASIFFSIRPENGYGKKALPSTDSLFGTGIDSVVLSLAYTAAYGDTNSVQSLKIFEIDQSAAFKDSSYPISTPYFNLGGTLLSTPFSFAVNALDDSVRYIDGKDTLTKTKELRIKLDKSFAQRLFSYDSAVFATDSSFRTKFKGIALVTDSVATAGTGALSYFSLTDTKTRLKVYYKAKNGADSSYFTSFILSSRTDTSTGLTSYPTANLVRRNSGGSAYGVNIANASTNEQKLYIQSSPGSYATIHIPGLAGLSNRLIHRAELIVERLAEPGDDKLAVPRLLFLDAIDSTGGTFNRFLTVPQDFLPDGNGFYDYTTLGGYFKDNKFNFNISRYVQGIVTKKEKSFSFRLYAPYETSPIYLPRGATSGAATFLTINTPIASGRTVVGGGSHPTQALRLRIIYSKI